MQGLEQVRVRQPLLGGEVPVGPVRVPITVAVGGALPAEEDFLRRHGVCERGGRSSLGREAIARRASWNDGVCQHGWNGLQAQKGLQDTGYSIKQAKMTPQGAGIRSSET